ncbi:dienelactone hydrolase family protein [Sphingobium sp. CAP-1]|uniref:dienelactone hydrolase family protein n=1 Tax=Sphingobium sp. CAP-1 TaxID=2676077 RepID=UPI0012BB2A48|nr:dienelactone hydrolase family protein [Sphingobium sp. CAP-1]QGP81161.1 dienelactone hydrolase family protein [Sphingobium sp. CAP-1]
MAKDDDAAGAGNATHYPRAILDLFDAYVHGAIDRRGFLQQCALHVGGTAAATATLAALSPDFARGQVVKPDDERLTISHVDIASPQGNGTIRAYVARRAADVGKTLPVIIVAHENRGLNPHIEDIARRLALDGFLAVAPDALTTLGGYPGDEDKARAAFATLDRAKIGEDFVAATAYARTMKGSNGRMGAVGFCFGGGIANLLATRIADLRAAVPFYGSPAPLADVSRIKAELLIHYGGNDERTNAGWPGYEAALKEAGISYKAYIYDGAEHGFNNDTTPRFNKAAADLAWGRTLALFKRTLA